MKNIRLKTAISHISTLMAIFLLHSCEKFVEVDSPNTLIVGKDVYNNDASATSAVFGVYINMASNQMGYATGSQSIGLLSGLSSDEFIDYTSNIDYVELQNNSVAPTNNFVLSTWGDFFKNLQNVNAVIEGIDNSTNISDHTRKQLVGEAKFLRAYINFYLVNLFGNVPLVLTTNYFINSNSKKEEIDKIYLQITSDLNDSKSLLSDNFLAPNNLITSTERVRPTKAAASSLLARVYLYLKKWEQAENEASITIENSDKFELLSDLNDVFLKNSKEAIWQIQPVVPNYNTFEGFTYIITDYPSYVSLNQELYNSFNEMDKRRNNWISSIDDGTSIFYFPYKYKIKTGSPTSEYIMVLRLSEQYLIRAEARTQNNNLEGAIADIDSIRSRAGLPLISNINPTISKEELLVAIEEERRHELFAEWGHRWLDLKRTDRADAVLGSKPGWESTDVLYPIPQNEILKNPNLKPQNDGY